MEDIGAKRLISSIILQAVKDANSLYKKLGEQDHRKNNLNSETQSVLEFFNPDNSWGNTLLSFQGLEVLPKEFQQKLNDLNAK